MRDLISRYRWTVLAGVSVLITAACLWLLLADDHAGYSFLRRLYQDKEFLKLTLREWGILAPVVFMAIQALQVVISPVPGEATGFLGGYLFGVWLGFVYSTVGLTVEPLMDWFMNGRAWGPQGSAHLSMAPHGHYPCRGEDQWASIAVEDDGAWARLAEALGHPAWARAPRFATPAGRQAHAADLDARRSDWTRERTAWEVTETLQQAGVAAFPVFGLDEQARDPHFKARGLVARPEHPRLGAVPVFAHPIKLADTPGEVRGPAPMLGEHNQKVFRGLLGLSAEEIERLSAEGIIA
jgi:hypothetical protein